MSLSNGPLFTSTTRSKPKPNLPTYDKDEHWSKTLERRPVGKKYGKGYGPKMFMEDKDNHIDNFDIDNDREEIS